MTDTDPLREQLIRALFDAIPDDLPEHPKPPLEENIALPWIERDVDAVLAVVQPAIREAQAEAWADCADTSGDYLAGGSVRAAQAIADMNPYRDERSTDDE